MLHILFVILKVIGILLPGNPWNYIVFGFSSLLIPFSYQIKGERQKETWNARIRLSWLFLCCISGEGVWREFTF